MRSSRLSAFILSGFLLLTVSAVPSLQAEEPASPGSVVEGAGFSLFDMESIKGFDAEKV